MSGAPSTSGAPGARPAPCCAAPRRALVRLVLAAALASAAHARARADEAASAAPAAALAVPVDVRAFEEALDRFVPVFPATTARYFGVTVDPRPGEAISATSEIERYAAVLGPPPGAAAILGLLAPPSRPAAVRLLPLVTLSAGGDLSRAWSAPGSAFASTGWQATVAPPSGRWRGRLSATLAEELRGASSAPGPGSPPGARVGGRTVAALRLRPADALSVELEAHRLSERGGPGDGVAGSGARAGLAVGLRPRLLELTAAGGVDRIQADADPAATSRASAALGLTAGFGRALTLSGSATVQTGPLSPAASAGALFAQLPASRIATAAATWRAGDRLQLSAALSRVGTPLGARTARLVRAALDPVAGGRLRLAAAYEESVDPASGALGAQAALEPSLRLSRYASVDARLAGAVRSVAGPVAHPVAVLVSFTIRS